MTPNQTPAQQLEAFLEEHQLGLVIHPIFTPNEQGVLAFNSQLSTIEVISTHQPKEDEDARAKH